MTPTAENRVRTTSASPSSAAPPRHMADAVSPTRQGVLGMTRTRRTPSPAAAWQWRGEGGVSHRLGVPHPRPTHPPSPKPHLTPACLHRGKRHTSGDRHDQVGVCQVRPQLPQHGVDVLGLDRDEYDGCVLHDLGGSGLRVGQVLGGRRPAGIRPPPSKLPQPPPASMLLPTTLAPKSANTSRRACTGSVAVTASGGTTPRAAKPRARASAIWPAPMKPTLRLSDMVRGGLLDFWGGAGRRPRSVGLARGQHPPLHHLQHSPRAQGPMLACGMRAA